MALAMHSHGTATGLRLKLAAGATSLFVVVEFIIGWRANSLALISDAGHNLTDVAALILSAWALAMATRPADRQRTFGYHRVGVLTALLNAVTLVLLAAYIFYEGYQRLRQPEDVASGPMILVALVALILNGGIALSLQRASVGDVNVRSAFVHMLGDALSSVGVVLAGVGVLLTGSSLWDPAVSLLIGGFILWSSWGIIRETVRVLLEGTPEGLDIAAVAQAMEAVPGVANVHDLHAWTLGPNVNALSAHVLVTNSAQASQRDVVAVVQRIKQMLANQYGIDHATLETHCAESADGCDTDQLACDIHLQGTHDYQHTH
jgi:cobalt-zinc-cadmium efflux system protein